MDILITGGTGQVGRELQALTWPADVRIHAPARAELDLADENSIERVVGSRAWSAIINSGAYTAVDKAESEPELAQAINADAPAQIARLAQAMNAPLVHLSTDYVFDGGKDAPYVEDDGITANSVYGTTKAEGETKVRAVAARSAIVRTAWVFSRHGSNFVKTMLRLAKERPALRVVADQRGSPTSAADLAAALQIVALRMAAEETAPRGVFHFTNAGEATWHELASAVIARAGQHGAPQPPIAAITTAEYPTPAKRPANSRLSTARIQAEYNITPRPWREAVNEVVDALCADAKGEAA